MSDFRKNIEGVDFNFHGVMEGEDQVFRVNAETHSFKMKQPFCAIWAFEKVSISNTLIHIALRF